MAPFPRPKLSASPWKVVTAATATTAVAAGAFGLGAVVARPDPDVERIELSAFDRDLESWVTESAIRQPIPVAPASDSPSSPASDTEPSVEDDEEVRGVSVLVAPTIVDETAPSPLSPVSAPSPVSPESVPSPDSPDTPDSPDSADSPDTVDSPDSADTSD
ncbi:MAG: hypothetical protein WD011_07145 [Nitriliruptoraceae bacterium]